MNKPTEIVLGAVGGAAASELLKFSISEAKKVLAFTPVSTELASTMMEVLPLITQIESLQDADELKTLTDTIHKALVLIGDCSGVQPLDIISKLIYTERVEEINKEIVKFCQIQVQLIQLRNQGMATLTLNNCAQDLKLLTAPAPPVYRRDLCSVPKLDIVPVGMDWPLMKLRKKLLDNSVDSLLVSSPPGCGKTTLVTQLCHDQDIKGKFKHIFFSVVSSTPKFRVIVQDLLEHNGHPPHVFENVSQATVAFEKLLEELIKDGPILLVLDDVWHGAEFSFLEKFQIKLPGYKILVTSRFDLPSFDFTYRLEPLGDEDAKSLLIQCASPPHHTCPDEYKDLVQKIHHLFCFSTWWGLLILKRCSGFPIVIKVVGGSLKGQPLHIWKGQVESWSEGETILGNPHPTVLERLEPSFSALKPHLKECFLDMGSFLEDQKIRASVIIDIWVELYGKGSTSSSSVYMKYLNDLASQHLLKLIPLGNEHENGRFYNELLVTQHDILRELSIHQSEMEAILDRKRLNLVIQEDNYYPLIMDPVNARLLSIFTGDSFTSSCGKMDCPNVEALLLNLSSSNYELPDFIATMKKLKVVVIINHGHDPAKLSNLSCLSSLPNLKRIRFEKISITLLDILQLQLGSLKKLSLVMCSFGEVSHDSKETDVSKALPSLQEIDIDYCYDLGELPYWVCEVVSLKTLSITNCNKLSELPEAIGNLSKLEVLRLRSCISLSELPETTERLSDLQIMDVSHCLGLRKLPLEMGKLQKLKKISMRKCSRCELPDSVRNLENLEVRCDEENGYLWKRLKPLMRNLSVKEEETEHNLNLLQMF